MARTRGPAIRPEGGEPTRRGRPRNNPITPEERQKRSEEAQRKRDKAARKREEEAKRKEESARKHEEDKANLIRGLTETQIDENAWNILISETEATAGE